MSFSSNLKQDFKDLPEIKDDPEVYQTSSKKNWKEKSLASARKDFKKIEKPAPKM